MSGWFFSALGHSPRMSEPSAAPQASVAQATEDDWAYIRARLIDTLWDVSEPSQREARGRHDFEDEVDDFLSRHKPAAIGLRERLTGSWRRRMPNQAFVLRGADGQRLGALWMATGLDHHREWQAWVLLVYVEPTHRGKGLGRMLMQKAEAWARNNGMRSVMLNVHAGNQPAYEFYLRGGYQQDHIWMIKRLQG